uniref:Glabrous enhancer-binding protein-like DBD domain-containing protein n=1 Tax=Oryza meridionalis TaxID=40149 RepID=A0A0E0DYP7_9ORYZ
MSSSRRPPARAAATEAAADAAPLLHPSSPRSKKRSSSSRRAAAADRRPAKRAPNPTLSPRGGAPSRKSERRRRPRSLALAVHGHASPSGGPGLVWNDADEVALLTAAVAFRARNGFAPRLPDMGALFESLRGSISSHIDQAKVYYKLKRNKSKFLHAPPQATTTTATPHDRRVRALSAELWGSELAPPAVEGDADAAEAADERDAEEGYIGGNLNVSVRLPVVSEVLGDYWRKNGRVLSGVSLERGLALVGPEEGRMVEAKWKRQLEVETQTQGHRHDLAKEVCAMLIDAVRGLGP